MLSSSSPSPWLIFWMRWNATRVGRDHPPARTDRCRRRGGESAATCRTCWSSLRQELEAIAVLLLNDTGRILARAGDLPDSNDEVSLLSSLLSIHSAGQKVARLIGQKAASNWHVFDGGQYDLIFAPVGMTHAMLVIGKGLADEERVLKTVDIFSAARTED